MAMFLVHGGSPVRILSPSVYGYMRGLKPCDIIVGIDEVPDDNVQDILNKVWSADSN